MFWIDFFAGASSLLVFMLVVFAYIKKIIKEPRLEKRIDTPNIKLTEFFKMDDEVFDGSAA